VRLIPAYPVVLIGLLLIHPFYAVSHTAEIPYVYGQIPQTASGASQNLSLAMMDYWISFTVSLDPNDRKGVKRECFATYLLFRHSNRHIKFLLAFDL
jgi:hypothetical protein